MAKVQTRYGVLDPVDHVATDPQGRVISCVPAARLTLATPLGPLTPQYMTDEARRPKVEPLMFHADGVLRNIALEEQTTVSTPAGRLPAELLTFHPSGALHRVFPLNGKLSGYWGLKEESSLAAPLAISTPAGLIEAKLVGLRFFASGALAGLTLWPGETVDINTPLGSKQARIGLTFHQSGALRSFEPAAPIPVPTPLGLIEAFDPHAQGIHGDSNSLNFAEDGRVVSLATPANTVSVTGPDGQTRTFAPDTVPNLCDEMIKDIVALRIYFSPDAVRFGGPGQESFDLTSNRFAVGRLLVAAFAPVNYECEM